MEKMENPVANLLSNQYLRLKDITGPVRIVMIQSFKDQMEKSKFVAQDINISDVELSALYAELEQK